MPTAAACRWTREFILLSPGRRRGRGRWVTQSVSARVFRTPSCVCVQRCDAPRAARYEAGAKRFMLGTLLAAREMRPGCRLGSARWAWLTLAHHGHTNRSTVGSGGLPALWALALNRRAALAVLFVLCCALRGGSSPWPPQKSRAEGRRPPAARASHTAAVRPPGTTGTRATTCLRPRRARRASSVTARPTPSTAGAP